MMLFTKFAKAAGSAHMHRTEPSAARISPKNGLESKDACSAAKDFELEDLALAYGPHMPAAHILFSVSDDLECAATERART
jgi:hypothetical protein